MTLCYLHGFASDGGGWKAQALAQFFPQAKIISPDLPANPKAVISSTKPLLEQAERPLFLFGTSLGGFYAYYFSALLHCPAFLFNPSLRPHQTLDRGIGHWTTFKKGRSYTFKREYLDQLATLKDEADQLIDPNLLYFYLAEDDDILDLSSIPNLFPDAAELKWYPNCGHSFSKFEKVLKELKQKTILR